MNGRQTSLEWRGVFFVVEFGEEGEFFFVDADDAVGVASGGPVVFVVFDAGHGMVGIALEAVVHGGDGEEVGNGLENRIRAEGAENVDAEFHVVIHFGKEAEFILKLKMRAQSGVEFGAEGAALGVVVDAFGVEEAGDGLFLSEPPGGGDETFVEVALGALQQGVVAVGVQKVLGAGLDAVFGEVVGAEFGAVGEGLIAEGGDFGGAELLDLEEGVGFAEESAFVPFEFDPGGIAEEEVETAAGVEEVGEFEFPVEETKVGGDAGGAVEAGELLAEVVDADDAELVGEEELFLAGAGVGEEGELGALFFFEAEFLEGLAFEDVLEFEEVVGVAGEFGTVFEGPEPEGAPVIHGELEASVGGGVADVLGEEFAGEAAVFVAEGGVGAGGGSVFSEDRKVVGGLVPKVGKLFAVLFPEAVGLEGEFFEEADVGGGVRRGGR